jgi:hypothetical protein
MRNGFVALFLLAALVPCAPSEAASQQEEAANPRLLTHEEPIPRTPDGKPDLQGFWQNRAPETPNINQGIETNPPSFQNPGGKSIVIDPSDGVIPYQPWAKVERDLRRLPQSSYDDPESHCFLAGVPRQMYLNVHQILQTPTSVLILYEFAHAVRMIPLDGRSHLSPGVRLWEGDSVGHWEGDTLVVDTTNNNGSSWLGQTGDFVSDAAHHVERFTMTALNTINYQVTITDPKVLARPFTMAFPLARVGGADYQLLEYACHEENLDLPHIKAVQEIGGGRPKRPR